MPTVRFSPRHLLLSNPARTRSVSGLLVMLLLLVSTVVFAGVKIDHKHIKKSKSGQRIEVAAKILDKQNGIKEVRAYFKSGYDTRFWFAPMRASGDGFVGVLPAPALGATSIQYRIYAVSGNGEFVKTELFSIKIEDDEDALARLEAKEPTSVEIDLDEIEQIRDLARRGGEPQPSQRVEVRNDVPGSQTPSNIVGFNDYIVVANSAPAAAGAGLAAATAIGAGGGLGAGAVIGGVAALGGVAVAAGASGGDDHHSDTAPPVVADRTVQCNNTTQQGAEIAERVAVELGVRSGSFGFRYETFTFPDRMRVEYEGRTLFDTGCVGTNGERSRTISFSGSSSQVVIDVAPNCDGRNRSTGWNFTVVCP